MSLAMIGVTQDIYQEIGHTKWVACGEYENLEKLNMLTFTNALETKCTNEPCGSMSWRFNPNDVRISFESGCEGGVHTEKVLEGTHTWTNEKKIITITSNGKEYKFIMLLTKGQLMLRRKYG
jgi:hypothetical protein